MNGRAVAMLVIFLVASTTLWFCKSGNQEPAEREKNTPLSMSGNSAAFNESFSQLLNAYYSLSEAFVKEDTVSVNAAAGTLRINAGNLKMDELKGDSTGMIAETARLFVETINGSAAAIMEEADLEEKRKDFNMVTDAMWSLTRTVRYDGQRVYYQYCPMAFDNSGAYWLSSSPEIRNPYFGDRMLTCGEIADSLDYSKR